MNKELDALIREHGLSGAAADALRELWAASEVTQSFPVDLPIGEQTTMIIHEPGDEDEPAAITTDDRYQFRERLGEGGFAEVWRVHDAVLGRTVAMKVLHARLLLHPRDVHRFLLEAKATGSLQHPHIVPVYDLGQLADGRSWFTMMEVHGQTLASAVKAAHEGRGWTIRRLVAAFLSMVQAVAYAHAHGVVHRDIKPSNVMVGDHGEVYVLDWGIAKLLGDALPSGTFAGDTHHTQHGWVGGTPGYMPPEQAAGEVSRVDERADVYALGAVLYHILEGRSAYRGSPLQILSAVLDGPPPPPWSGHPPELLEVVARAMARDPADRYRDASAMVGEVQDWLEGVRRKEQATAVAQAALGRESAVRSLRQEAARLEAEGDALLVGVPVWASEEQKAAGWAAHDEGAEVAVQAELADLEVDQGLQAALRLAPDLTMAQEALVDRTMRAHMEAEARRDTAEARKQEHLLANHARHLPAGHPALIRAEAYLDGDGALSVATEPPGAEVFVYRYVEQRRRLVEVFDRVLGRTPLSAAKLPHGRYLCVLRHPDRAAVRLPVEVRRRGHSAGIRPGSLDPTPLVLPETIGSDEVYIAAGWFAAGSTLSGMSPRRLWCDAFFIQRDPVTNRDYLQFLHALVARGEVERALELAPRERSATPGESGALLLDFDGGRFTLRPDAQGDLWGLDWPVVQVDWHGAMAYAAWWAQIADQPWRLPSEFEWEKAARGVDGRTFPWGDRFDRSWARVAGSTPGRSTPGPVEEFPVDVSPYGVRGMAGNVQDWCLDSYDTPLPPPDSVVQPILVDDAQAIRMARGGAWDTSEMPVRSASRSRAMSSYRSWLRGFRLARTAD